MGARISRSSTTVRTWKANSSEVSANPDSSSSDTVDLQSQFRPHVRAPEFIADSTLASVSAQIDTAEESILRCLTTEQYERRHVRLPSGIWLNTISAGSISSPTLVVLHGWGAGAGFFARNLEGLAKHFRVYVVDWPGFGFSSRPPFDSNWSPVQAENFFVDALCEWVKEMPRLDKTFPSKFHIAAHSLGAYLSVAFALRAPQHVINLILASPVGIPPAPSVKLSTQSSWVTRSLLRALFVAWDAGFTPQFVIRNMGSFLGRRLARYLIEARFVISDIPARRAIVEYFYQISCAPSSGEMSLSTILESGAYARRPLCDRLPGVCVPVTFIYGDRDWISPLAAEEVCRKMNVSTEILIAPLAGHHLYFDNPDFFNAAVFRACSEAHRKR